MKKYFLIGLFLVIGSLTPVVLSQTQRPTATPVSQEESDTIKVSTTLIQLDVVVTDNKDNQVTGLKLDDFEVFENGEKLDIANISYISSESENKSNSSNNDSLNLQSDEDGFSLKDKIKIPKVSKPLDSKTIRRTFVLVVDNLGLNFSSVQVVKKSLKKFINEQVKEGDLATIATTAGSRVLPPFTSNKKELLAIVNKLKWSPQSRGGADSYEPIRNTLLEDLSEGRGEDLPGTKEEAAFLEDIDRSRINNSAVGTLGSLTYIVNGMRVLRGRKALVFFSDGFSLSEKTSQESTDSDGQNADEINTSSGLANNRFSSGVPGALRSLIETANKSSVVIYAVDPRGLQYLGMANADDDIRTAFGRNFKPGETSDKRTVRDDYFRQSQDGLRVLASETGGFAILNQNNLDNGLKRIIDDQSYYLLSFITNVESVASSKDVIDKVEIKVKNPNLQVRYRSAFYSPDSKNAERNLGQTPREKMGLALAYPFESNEIKLNLYSIMGNDLYGDFIRFLINISAEDILFERESKGSRVANFDVMALTLDSDDKPIHQFAKNFTITVNEPTYKNILKRGFVYTLPVVLKKSGVYHFRAAIRDSKTGKVGAASTFLETPKFEKKRLWISNLTLKSVSSQNAIISEPENEKRLYTDTTLREFEVPVTLNYGAVIYNAKTKGNTSPELTLQTRLIRDDKIILETPPESISTDDQKDLQRIDLSGRIRIQNNLPPGDYIFQIIITDNLAAKKTQTATQWIDFEVLGK